MIQPDLNGVRREGLDEVFTADENRKSNLLLTAQLLRAQGQDEAAAAEFAEAAVLEESLGERCQVRGLLDKALIHRFSAASCWAQAGNFYRAIALCEEVLTRTHLSEPLRRRVEAFSQTLRNRRAKWYADLVLETA